MKLRFFFWFAVDVGQAAFATVLSVKVRRHEDSGTTVLVRTLTTQARNFAVFIDLTKEYHKHINKVSTCYYNLNV